MKHIPLQLNIILTELDQLSRSVLDMPRRVELCRQALALLTKRHNPQMWATLQVELANSLAQNPRGNRSKNIEAAIVAYNQALTVRTQITMHIEWAQTMMNLADVYLDRVSGDSIDNTRQAIKLYERVLETLREYGHETIRNSVSERILKASAKLDRILSDKAEHEEPSNADTGTDVIVDDILYLGESMSEDDTNAQAIVELAEELPYFSAGGNDGEQSYEDSYQSSEITGE